MDNTVKLIWLIVSRKIQCQAAKATALKQNSRRIQLLQRITCISDLIKQRIHPKSHWVKVHCFVFVTTPSAEGVL